MESPVRVACSRSRSTSVADAPSGNVDDAQQTGLIEGVVDETQVGDQVLDFAALVEADAPNEAVRDAVTHKRLFDCTGLGVGPVHDGDVAIGAASGDKPGDFGGGEFALLFVAVGLVGGDEVAALAFGPQLARMPVRVLADDAVGSLEDGRRGTVILFEQVDSAAREVTLEVLDVSHIGASPGVDALVRVADDGDVAVDRGQLTRECILHRVVSWNSSTRTWR